MANTNDPEPILNNTNQICLIQDRPKQQAWIMKVGKNIIKRIQIEICGVLVYDSDKDLSDNKNSYDRVLLSYYFFSKK